MPVRTEAPPPWPGLTPGAVSLATFPMPVPLLDVNAQNHPLEAEFTEAFLRVFRSGQFIMGSEVTALETALAELTGSRHCLGVSSGTDAILLALMALDIGPGDEVLVPTFTFFATGGCVSRTGATPVFVDACPVCFNLDVEDARAKLTSRTKAIIPVHLFGQSADMDPILALAGEHGLRVLEDAAQSLGAGYRDRPCGSLGDFGTYSFFPSKNLGGFGDAGALVCQDDALAERARILRNHGSQPKYYHHWVGGNFRLDPLQAAMLRVKLPHYGDYTARRQANAAFYTEHLGALPGVAVAPVDWHKPTLEYDLALSIAEDAGALAVTWQYSTDLFDHATMAQMAAQGDRQPHDDADQQHAEHEGNGTHGRLPGTSRTYPPGNAVAT